MGKEHQCFQCTICGTEINVPLCCEKQMEIVDSELVCSLCGSNQEIPICCNQNQMQTIKKKPIQKKK
ncbi:MAG: hypothetical protein AABW64_00950 [Nanoarchaeota archaeon]